jgi:hypothetical protein
MLARITGSHSTHCAALAGSIASIWPRFSAGSAALVFGGWRATGRDEVALARHGTALDNDVVKQVLGYFVRNPKTADTLEGIARWRLLEERVQKSLLQTEAAIDWLVGQKYLEEVMVAGSKEAIFRLNPERRSDAVRLLAKNKAGRVREKS